MKIMPLFYWGIYGCVSLSLFMLNNWILNYLLLLIHHSCLLRSPIPYKNPLYIVVGKPIQIEKNPEPTMEQVKHSLTLISNYNQNFKVQWLVWPRFPKLTLPIYNVWVKIFKMMFAMITQTWILTSFIFGFRLRKYRVNLWKHLKISLNVIKLKPDIQIFNWKFCEKANLFCPKRLYLIICKVSFESSK